MSPVKRIEIVVAEFVLPDLFAILKRRQTNGYTVATGLSGRGDRGVQTGEGAVGEFANASVIIACNETAVGDLLDDVRKLLKRYGGICLVSDAMWLEH
jgi:nitrogen regulatory protein PII